MKGKRKKKKKSRGERRIGLSIRAMNMSDEELKALADETADETADSGSQRAGGSENLGGLSAAFDSAFANVEWQPGEAN